MGDLNAKQREAAFSLLATVLSKEGYQKVIDIMDADQQLTTGQGRRQSQGGGKGNLSFGKDNYFLAVFGTPSTAKPWLVQFGGHHLGVNVTLIARTSCSHPLTPALQPASFSRTGITVRRWRRVGQSLRAGRVSG